MILYHGSPCKIEKPALGVGNPHNDYGQGFYCTESRELAKEWACQKNTDGFANEYDLDLQGLKILNLSKPPFNLLHWISILMQNRVFAPKSPLGRQNLDFLKETFKLNSAEADVIIGYRANDSYFSFASDFLENIIPLQNLASSMKLGSLGLQVVLKSALAFKQLRYIQSEQVQSHDYFQKYKQHDTEARKKYLDGLRNVKPAEAIYLLDIVRHPEILNDISL